MQQQITARPGRVILATGPARTRASSAQHQSADILDFRVAKTISDAVAARGTGTYPPAVELSLPTERELIERWKATRDRQALLRLVMTMQPFLKKVARKHGAARGIEQDLIHDGVVAIILALERYQPVEDCRLLSFVWRRIMTAMSLGRQSVERIVDRPQEKPRRRKEGATSSSTPPTSGSHSSIDDIDETILSTRADDPERVLLQAERDGELVSVISGAIKGLTNFERELIICRLEEGDFDEVAARHGATPELARKTETRALQKMRMSLMMNGYAGVTKEEL